MNDALSRLRSMLDQDADDLVAGVSLIGIAIIVCVWGVMAIVDSYHEYGRPDLPRWHPRRWIAPSFGFYLGWFLFLVDGVIYAVIGFDILTSPERLELGWTVYLVGCGALAAMAFYHWSRDRMPKRRVRR